MKKKALITIPAEIIQNKIYLIRGRKVMFDRDLAVLYGVKTGNLNKAVDRNRERFPDADFMFSLTKEELKNLISQFGTSSSRFQIGTLKRGENIKYLPHVFTEQGVAMLSSVLNSKRAVNVNIQIIKTFIKMREFLASHKALREKVEIMEKKYDKQFKIVFQMLLKEEKRPKIPMGFRTK